MTRFAEAARGHPWALAWFGLAVVTAVAVIVDDFGVFAPDTKPELYLNPGRLLHRSLYAWQPDPHLGQVNYNTGILPVAAVMTVLHATGIEPWLLQRLVMIATLLVGAWGAAQLVTELTGRRGAGPWLAGVVHAWHPWTIVGAATLPVRLPHAVLPWLLLLTHRAVTRGGPGWAAAAGLAYGAMAGINGGVVNLMYVIPVLVLVVWDVVAGHVRVWQAVGRFATLGIIAVGVSLYWLVPSLVAAASSASDVLAVTEDPTAIGRLSPPAEVLRGLGMWTSYIVIDGQIENFEQIRLLTNPAVVLAGFLLTVAGLVALVGADHRVRGLVAGLAVVGLALLVGINESGGMSPVGRGLQWLFDTLPAAAAFRTTNKFGTMLVLALALAIGAGIDSPDLTRTLRMSRRAATGGVALLVVIAAGPILPGQLHPLQIPVPEYWHLAADATDTDPGGRLLFLPGNAQTRYVWGYRGVDDLDLALFDQRHVAWRSTIPAGSRAATNLLTSFDVGLQLGALHPESRTAYTQLLGAVDALVRTDTDWIRNFGRPTGLVLEEVLATPGVSVIDTFGPTGAERALSPAIVPDDAPALTHVKLPATSIAQAWRLAAPLLVVGDAMAVDQLVRAGLDPVRRPMLYVDDLTDEQLLAALSAGGEIVLTDTNHRRSWAISSVTDSYTPLLGADDEVAPSDQRARTIDPATQTVSDESGPSVSALPDPYSLFRRRAAGHPGLAFDGNPLTGWQYGTNTSGVGGWVEARVDEGIAIEGVEVQVGLSGKSITSVRIDTDAGSREAPIIDGVAAVELVGLTEHIRVTITGTSGVSLEPATVLEITALGDHDWQDFATGARLPTTLTDRAKTSVLEAALSVAPFRLHLSRAAGDPADTFDDEEVTLRRRFSVPWDVLFPPTGLQATVRFWDAGDATRCQVIGSIENGSAPPIQLRARATEGARPGEPTNVVGCGSHILIESGENRFTSAPDVIIDHLALGSDAPAADGTVDARLDVSESAASPTAVTLRLAQPATGWTVVSSGRARHDGWRATADDQRLPDPITTSGYANGWLVPPGTASIDLHFSPQASTAPAQAASALTAIVAVFALRRRRGGPS